MRATQLPLALGAALLASAAALGLSLAERAAVKPYDVLHVPSGGAARIAALGHRTFVSDLYWLSAVQYIGERQADRRGWAQLQPLIDLVTDLDPRHGYAYQTGGIVLSAAGLLDESDAILKKGMEKGPPWWTFPYYLAFNWWFYRGDYATAAKYAEVAAGRPGASPNISHLAVSLASKSGTPEEAIALLHELKSTVQDEQTAGRLDEQLKLAILERDAQMLERTAARFRKERGHAIGTLRDLTTAGLVDAIPTDPFGGEYVWDVGEGKVHSSANPFRFSLQARAHAPKFQYRPPGSEPSGPGVGVLR
jgi:hypothetical protein